MFCHALVGRRGEDILCSNVPKPTMLSVGENIYCSLPGMYRTGSYIPVACLLLTPHIRDQTGGRWPTCVYSSYCTVLYTWYTVYSIVCANRRTSSSRTYDLPTKTGL
jgi:hypothetical protein